jgi:hypothetical protein
MGQLRLSVGITTRALQEYNERPLLPHSVGFMSHLDSRMYHQPWCAVQATRGATHPARMSHAILGVDPSLHVLLCSPALCTIVAILPLNEYVPHILYTYTPAISHLDSYVLFIFPSHSAVRSSISCVYGPKLRAHSYIYSRRRVFQSGRGTPPWLPKFILNLA